MQAVAFLGAFFVETLPVVELSRPRFESVALRCELRLERTQGRSEPDQLVVGLLTELAGTGRAALSLGEQGSLADRERRGTSGHLCFPFRGLEPRPVEPLTCGRRVGTQLLELIAVLRRRLARVCRFLRFGREPCTLGLERAFALLELTRTRCENAVQLSE